ncbi:toxin-antitoxin system YwqK family antitoxin [Candidatus Palauibacter sp.]|uniref:toxin-antitoxin system YwqK family antitoxin n=1 Tax=Candidatus Palauibacter sp. TaxID=3101350 RepID=UPI003C700F15
MALLPLMAPGAHAQVLLEEDGIELRGRARRVERGAGTCYVSEERETAESYERKKANHGERVDLWRLDFSVHNGSGEPLDHLIADYRIVSENPPCTNWSWPDTERYPGPIGWGNLAGLIQRSGPENATPPGERLTHTQYVFVFHHHEPLFRSASVDFNFGTDAPAAPAAAPAPAPADATPASDGPEGICGPEPSPSGCWRAVADHPECYVWVSKNLDQTVTWSGECSDGYAQGTGTIGLKYGDLVPPTPDRTAHGLLVDGKRQGSWVIRFGPARSWEGPFVDGMKHGLWVEPRENGRVAEGLMLHGKRHGDWVHRESDGTVRRGPWLTDDEGPLRLTMPHGIWASWEPGGTIDQWFVVRGSQEGTRIRWQPDGTVGRFSFVGDERHGLTIFCFPRPETILTRLDIHQNDELQFTYESLGAIPYRGLADRVVSECARLFSVNRPEPPP